MNRKLLVTVVLWSTIAIAQQTVEQQMQRSAPQDGGAPQAAKVTPEQRERAKQLLEVADAQAHGMKDAGSRAFALLQLARAYNETDKAKAVAALVDALSATRGIEGDEPRFRRIRGRLQEQIVDQLIPLAPDKIDDILGQVDAPGREKVLNSLLRYYEKRKENGKALQTIDRIAQEFEIPYDAAGAVMSNLTPEQAAEKEQLFTACLASYRDHEHEGVRFGGGDFGALVAQFSDQLPPAIVRQAIDVLLDEARRRAKKDAESSQPTNISMSSSKGALAFSSYYDYRLFQLLPALKTIDPQEAEKLLKERQDVQTLLTKYPAGMSSLSPEPQGAQQGPGRGPRPGLGTSMMVTSGGAGGPGGRNQASNAPRGAAPNQQGPNPLEMQRMAKLIEDAGQHPQESIAGATTIASPEMRVQTYVGIARESWKKNPSAAKLALGKASDAITELKPDQQLMGLRDLATLYERLDDTDNAKKTIEKGLDAAEKLLKADTNADDPNQAPKAYWPSTGAYRSMLALATKISPRWATLLLKEIPDDDLKALNQIAIANALLGVRGGTLEVMQFTKDSGRMMIMDEDQAER